MVLNETGRSTWDWRQNSLLTVDRSVKKVIYNPEYFAMKHFSTIVQPGAKRIGVDEGPLINAVAYLNPNRSKVVVFANDSEEPITVDVEAEWLRVKLDVPARSMNTVVFP
jgi:glucosylceramidase